MKKTIITTAIILTGCLCAWGYLAAQLDKETTTPAKSSLLEIREPSQEDFEHCAKRAVDFFESISEEQVKTDIAFHDLYGKRELSPDDRRQSMVLTKLKAEIKFARPELTAKNNIGETVIILCYNYITGEGILYSFFFFERTIDQNGELQQWRCLAFNMNGSPEGVLNFRR